VKLLLDSHSFLWAMQQPRRLSATARAALGSKQNAVAVSSVCFWEISLKCSLGRLVLEGTLPANLPAVAVEHEFMLHPLNAETAASIGQLPRLPEHRDPFDRMLVWQAIRERWTLVSRDGAMAPYAAHGLELLW
jgi:PIN domain nuclease of toxin-antitoxin system